MALFHQFIPNEPAKPQTSKPAKKPTTKPVEKTAAHSTTSERIEPPEPVSPPKSHKSHAVSAVSVHGTHCPTCGQALPKFDRVAYQRVYMRGWRARQKQEKP